MSTERDSKQLKRGRNPIEQVGRKPPKLGQIPQGNPTSTGGFLKPNGFSGGGGIRGSFSGRLGEEGIPNRGSGVVEIGPPNPDLSTDYFPGTPTNYVVPVAKIARRFKYNLMQSPQLGLVIITEREQKDPISKRSGMENRRYTMLNVPAWNYMKAKFEKNPNNPEEVKNAEQIWEDWTIEGVVRSEEGQEEKDYKDELGKERLINTIVRGYAHVHNAWPKNIKSGTNLYLILKKIKQKAHKIDPYSSVINDTSPSTTSTNNGNITETPFQLISWADSRYDIPPDSELEYEDEFGVRHRGKYIYIGSVETPATYPKDIKLLGKSDINLDSLLAEPKIFIFVDA